MLRNTVTEYVDISIREIIDSGKSPCQFGDYDDYEDSCFDIAKGTVGNPNIAQKVALRKWLREDWDNYYRVKK